MSLHDGIDINSMIESLESIEQDQAKKDEEKRVEINQKIISNKNPLASLPLQSDASKKLHDSIVNEELERLQKLNRIKPKQSFLKSKALRRAKRANKKKKCCSKL